MFTFNPKSSSKKTTHLIRWNKYIRKQFADENLLKIHFFFFGFHGKTEYFVVVDVVMMSHNIKKNKEKNEHYPGI